MLDQTTNKPTMNPALRSFWSKPSRGKVLHGGRGSSKSWDAAARLVWITQAVKVRALCTRMFQNKIQESVYNLIKSQAERFGVAHEYDFQQTRIIHRRTGSEILFYGLARNIDEIKSLEGIDILWMEEAHNLTETMWDTLEPTIIRNKGSEVWVIFNPRLRSDFAYQRFVENPPTGYVVRQINYNENPFLDDGMVKAIQEMERKDPEKKRHVYDGVPDNDDDQAVIKSTWLESAVDAHIKLGIEVTGSRRIGFDVADDGSDMNATCEAHGILCEGVSEWKGLEDKLLMSCARVYSRASEIGASITYDSIGVGATAGAKFSELNVGKSPPVQYSKFNAGSKVINPDREYMPNTKNRDHFANLKAQAWWLVADRLRATHEAVTNGGDFDPSEIISISSECQHLEKLITELSTPHRHFDSAGKVKVESKQDLAKRDVKSPNLADAFIMAYAPVEQQAMGMMVKARHRR